MKKLYIRFGEPCPDGISRKYGFNGEPIAKENGLSCYDAIPAKTSDGKEGWKPVGRSKKSERLMDPTIKIYRKPELQLLSRKGKEKKKLFF